MGREKCKSKVTTGLRTSALSSTLHTLSKANSSSEKPPQAAPSEGEEKAAGPSLCSISSGGSKAAPLQIARPDLVTEEVPVGVALDDQKNYSQCIKRGFSLILRGSARGKRAQERLVLQNKRPVRLPRDSHRAWQTPGQGGAQGTLRPADALLPPTAKPGSPQDPSPGRTRARPHLRALPAPPAPSRPRRAGGPAQTPPRRRRGTTNVTSAPCTGRCFFYAPFATAGKESVAARAWGGAWAVRGRRGSG